MSLFSVAWQLQFPIFFKSPDKFKTLMVPSSKEEPSLDVNLFAKSVPKNQSWFECRPIRKQFLNFKHKQSKKYYSTKTPEDSLLRQGIVQLRRMTSRDGQFPSVAGSSNRTNSFQYQMHFLVSSLGCNKVRAIEFKAKK